MKKNHRLFIYILSSFHACLMMFFAFLLLRQPFVHGNEVTLISFSSILKNTILKLEKKPPKKDFIFVNVAYDKQLTDKFDEFGFPLGKTPITDRKKLANFFHVLNQKPDNQKFIICDIFFKEEASIHECSGDSISSDILLQKELEQCKNLLISYHYNEKDSLDLPIFTHVHRGIADYVTAIDNTFLKFKLLHHDSVKALPLLMYEQLHQTKLKEGFFFYYLNNHPILQAFIPEIRIRNYDIFQAKDHYKINNLENLLMLPPEEILENVKDRIVVIGDFEKDDNHETIYGETAGPLILLNTYLALSNGDNIIRPLFLLFLFACYFGVSVLIFYPNNPLESRITKYFAKTQLKFLISFLSYMSLLIGISILSYFLFGIHLNILYLSLYLYVLKQLILWMYQHWNPFGLVSSPDTES